MQSTVILASIFGGFGFVEVVIVGLIGLLVFGKRLPDVGRNLGRSISEFKRGISDSSGSAKPHAPSEPPAAFVNTTAQLPPGPSAVAQEALQTRIARLAAELQSLEREAARQRDSQPS